MKQKLTKVALWEGGFAYIPNDSRILEIVDLPKDDKNSRRTRVSYGQTSVLCSDTAEEIAKQLKV